MHNPRIQQLLDLILYLLFKSKSKWTTLQITRAELLFGLYPSIEKAYNLAQGLCYIFENNTNKNAARLKLAQWYNKVEETGFKSFNTISRTIQIILNYFNNRSTNASSESFNAKIKDFRRQFRGVRDIPFFLYRLTKIYS